MLTFFDVNTSIQICRVPWDSTYRDVVSFKNDTERDSYFFNLSKSSIILESGMIFKYGSEIRLSIPYATAINYNYLIADLPYDFVGQEQNYKVKYFYFIQKVEYLAPNTTIFYLSLDYWQTYQFDVDFGRCFVEQGHIGVSATCNMKNQITPRIGRDYLNVPEPYDLGTWYESYAPFYVEQPTIDEPFVVIFSSTIDLFKDFGTLEAPQLSTADGTQSAGILCGATQYWVTMSQFKMMMSGLSNYSWISQGINSITIFPYDYIAGRVGGQTKDIGGATVHKILDSYSQQHIQVVKNLQHPETDPPALPERYKNLWKFNTSPYLWLSVEVYGSGNYKLAPERIKDYYLDKLNNLKVYVRADSAISNPCLTFGISDVSEVDNATSWFGWSYVDTNDPIGLTIDGGDFLGWELPFPRLPFFTTVNNMALLNIANNAYNYQLQEQSANQSLEKTKLANDLANSNLAITQAASGDVQNVAQSAARAQLSNSQSLENSNFALQSIQNIGGAALGGGALSGPGGAAAGAVGGLVNTAFASAQMQNSQNTARQNLSSAQGVDSFALARQNQAASEALSNNNVFNLKTSSMDYNLAMQSITSQKESAKLTPPSILGQQAGNNIYTFGYYAVVLKWQKIQPHAMRTIGEQWLRYGYHINDYIDIQKLPLNLNVMDKASYWRMTECNILHTSKANNEAISIIKGIFERGTTVYQNPYDIGILDFANQNYYSGVFWEG